MTNEDGLSSIKVMNHFKKILNMIPQYSSSEINRDQQALRLELSSYSWGFDIVPGFRTIEDNNGNSYYIIPNGSGAWEKTNPKIDRENINSYSNQMSINLRETIRILKYWKSKHIYIQKMSSYMLETMVLDYIDSNTTTKELNNPRVFINEFLQYLTLNISFSVDDRKKIQGNLNDLAISDQYNIKTQVKKYQRLISEANRFECFGDDNHAILNWKKFFGE